MSIAPTGKAFRSEDRLLPHDLVAEQSALGGMLLSADVTHLILSESKIFERDFYAPKHEIIFGAIRALANQGEPTDVVTLSAELVKLGKLSTIGGAEYLHELTAIVPTAASATFYANIVREKAILRRLIEAGTRIAQRGYDGEGEVDDQVNTAQNEIYGVADDSSGKDYTVLATALQMAADEIELVQRNQGLAGVPTGFTQLDKTTNGLHPGQLVIIAARPGLGKSTLALDIAREAAINKKLATAIFSLEMSQTEIAMRLLSAETSIYLQSMRAGSITDNEWAIIAERRSAIANAPLIIDDSPNLNIVEIRAKCRRMIKEWDLKLIIIDYIQLMTSGKKVENRQQEVSEFSRSLKLLAKELKVPVVALSQLNRKSEEGSSKKPELSQLRESGSLEQDADLVILIHREFNQQENTRVGEAELILAKQRNGPTGSSNVLFQGQYSRFVNPKE
ncbi:MAG: replicative DNA helicase [Actinobacteria bacterium]|nr:replicative DNA helicase [Actinomycetota bacterium]NBY43659.1 replicative DNA helicase [Micrococcales bacterium]